MRNLRSNWFYSNSNCSKQY